MHDLIVPLKKMSFPFFFLFFLVTFQRHQRSNANALFSRYQNFTFSAYYRIKFFVNYFTSQYILSNLLIIILFDGLINVSKIFIVRCSKYPKFSDFHGEKTLQGFYHGIQVLSLAGTHKPRILWYYRLIILRRITPRENEGREEWLERSNKFETRRIGSGWGCTKGKEGKIKQLKIK